MFSRIKAEFMRKLIYQSCCWSFEFKSCFHVEWTFFSIASNSTNKSTQSFGLIGWWRSYINAFLARLTIFVQLDPDIPFCIIEIDGYTIVFGFWSDEWRKMFNVNQNRKFDSAICWLAQNPWRWEMANF